MSLKSSPTLHHLQRSYLLQNCNMESPPLMEEKASDPFGVPFCKLNLREAASDPAESFPIQKTDDTPDDTSATVQRRAMEAPPTPGRPLHSFNSIGSPLVANFLRKSHPSKWDDAEKWLINSSCNDSPGRIIKAEPQGIRRQPNFVRSKMQPFTENLLTTLHRKNGLFASDNKSDFLDKYTDITADPTIAGSSLKQSEPTIDRFSSFPSSVCETLRDAGTAVGRGVQHRDVGTETTPLESLSNSRFQSPTKMPSPPRHNTPAARSGPLGPMISDRDLYEIHDTHFADLDFGNQFSSIDVNASNWSSREEEEEEISRSLRHFEAGAGRKSIGDCKVSLWGDVEDRTKCCIRYKREEAKIQAWLNLQDAKAEAQSRKLEVKIQKLRSKLEEKLMKRMAVVHRKAEEWKAAALLQHSEHMLKASGKQRKISNAQEGDSSACGCFH